MVRVVFQYRDEMSNGEWRTQECLVSSVEEAKRIYGLDGSDPSLLDYKIIKVEEC
jgi:hypothetical protein